MKRQARTHSVEVVLSVQEMKQVEELTAKLNFKTKAAMIRQLIYLEHQQGKYWGDDTPKN